MAQVSPNFRTFAGVIGKRDFLSANLKAVMRQI